MKRHDSVSPPGCAPTVLEILHDNVAGVKKKRRAAQKIYYGLLYWQVLRKSSLLKLINVSESAYDNAMRQPLSEDTPAEEVGSLLYGKRIPVCANSTDTLPQKCVERTLITRGERYTEPPNHPLSFGSTEPPAAVHQNPPRAGKRIDGTRVDRQLRIVRGENNRPCGEDWAVERHPLWCSELAASLASDMNYFLPGLEDWGPFVVLPELLLRKKLQELDPEQRQLILKLNSEERRSHYGPRECRKHPEYSDIIAEMDQLGSLPDALFISRYGCFFLEVELWPKSAAAYAAIFEKLKHRKCFLLYLIKDKSSAELTFNHDEWTCFTAAACEEPKTVSQGGPAGADLRADRLMKRFQRNLQQNDLIPGDIRAFKAERGVSETAIAAWHATESLRGHMAAIRIDRDEHFREDRERASTRLRHHFDATEVGRKRELSVLFDHFRGTFLANSADARTRTAPRWPMPQRPAVDRLTDPF